MKNTIGLGIMGVVAAAVLLCGGLGGAGQVAEASGTPAETATLEMLADKIALKELVDTFSILADRKDGLAQEALFTPDAVVENYGGDGKLMTSLKGSKEIAKVYDDFLKTQDVVYHINGQQVVWIDGDKATGTSYCYVVLISTQDGKKVKRTQGMRYEDEYEKRDGKWLISKRVAHFNWIENEDFKGM